MNKLCLPKVKCSIQVTEFMSELEPRSLENILIVARGQGDWGCGLRRGGDSVEIGCYTAVMAM